MSQSEKSAYYAALKEGGVTFAKHYRDYTTSELKKMYVDIAPADAPEPVVQTREAPAPPVSVRNLPPHPEATLQPAAVLPTK